MDAALVLDETRAVLVGDPVFMAGSLMAAVAYDKPTAFSDVDLFCPSDLVLVTTVQKLLDNGYMFKPRFDRVWARWLQFGFKKWHTNSMRMESPGGDEVNVVYKLQDGHPTTSLGQVLESFDFGMLATGYDLKTDQTMDMRSFLFPHHDIDGPLPLMPAKREAWRNGFISQYNGLREAGRYAKYHGYGYDMSLVKDDLVIGYRAAASYMATTFDPLKQQLGEIYDAIGDRIQADEIDELAESYKSLDFNDSLDAIMEALE